MNHWVLDYLKARWEPNGRGPDVYDCWGLVMAVSAGVYGVVLPEVNYEGAVAATIRGERGSDRWRRLHGPIEGCVVAMHHGNTKVPVHVGVYIGGYVIHCSRQRGVTCDTLDRLKVYGYGKFAYYSYVGGGAEPVRPARKTRGGGATVVPTTGTPLLF